MASQARTSSALASTRSPSHARKSPGERTEAPDRRQVLLHVEGQRRLGRLAEVDGQLGDAQERLIGEEQPRLGTVRPAHRDASRQAEVAVQPGRQQRAAVGLDAQQLPAGAGLVGVRLDPQVRAVGVSADDPERPHRTTRPVLGGPRHQRAAPDQVVAARLRGERLGLVDLDVAVGLEQAACGEHGVERRGRRVDEVDEALDGGVGVGERHARHCRATRERGDGRPPGTRLSAASVAQRTVFRVLSDARCAEPRRHTEGPRGGSPRGPSRVLRQVTW